MGPSQGRAVTGTGMSNGGLTAPQPGAVLTEQKRAAPWWEIPASRTHTGSPSPAPFSGGPSHRQLCQDPFLFTPVLSVSVLGWPELITTNWVP